MSAFLGWKPVPGLAYGAPDPRGYRCVGRAGRALRERRGKSSPAALITAIAALVGALGGLGVAIRALAEPDATKISAGSEEISRALQAEHDQVVALNQAVLDLSKNADQNHAEIAAMNTALFAELSARGPAPGKINVAVGSGPGSAPPPALVPLKPVAVPKAPPTPPIWRAATNSLERSP